MNFLENENGSKSSIDVNTSIYGREAITSAAYKFSGKCFIKIEPKTDMEVVIFFELKDGVSESLEDLKKEFLNELLDQQLRVDINRQFGEIRDAIVKKAFSPLQQ